MSQKDDKSNWFGNKPKPNKKDSLQVSSKSIEDQKKFDSLSYEEKLQIVKDKIRAYTGNKEEEMLELCAKPLFDKTELQKSYLNKNFKSTMEFFSNFDKNQRGSISNSGQQDDEVDEWDSKKVLEENEKSLRYKLSNKVKVKLVVTEISFSDKQKHLRKLVSPFISTFGIGPRMGLFHSALIIGPYYFEWTNKSLCVPKKVFSSAALIAVDVENTLATMDVDFVIDKVSDVIVRWNCVCKYDQSSNNCQVFIEDLLVALGIDQLKFKGQLAGFLKDMRTHGSCEPAFTISSELAKATGLSETKTKFESHKELDTFVQKIVEKYPKFSSSFPGDYELLKSFDRAFWLKHFRAVDEENFQPLSHKSTGVGCDCPFENPKVTKSFGGTEWF
jgi:hypothetical protein